MAVARDIVITAIDFEGTGAVQGYDDEPWQIGLIQIRSGEVSTTHQYEKLLRVGDRPFNRYAPGRHADVRASLRSAPRLPDLWSELRPYLAGIPLAAHNAATEKRYLSKAFPIHVPAVWIDTLKLARMAYPSLKSYKLEDVLDVFSLLPQVDAMIPDREPHDALYDAVGCAVFLCHLLQQPGWSDASLDDLIALHHKRSKR